jgi:hypothetical protein
MNFTLCASQPEKHTSPHFDTCQFGRRGRFLHGSQLCFQDIERMHLLPIADLCKGRKFATPEWALSDEQLREVLVSYLERRLMINRPKGNFKERLARATAAAKERARAAKSECERWVAEYRALSTENFSELPLRGESPADRLRRVEQYIQNLDSEAYLLERAAELVLAIAYYFYRLGWNSSTIAETLSLKSPHVRQILARMNRAARCPLRKMRTHRRAT